MATCISPIAHPTTSQLRDEIERFMLAARCRCEVHPNPRRRSRRRYHRSWPLRVSLGYPEPLITFSAALHNANEQGIAFLSSHTLLPGTLVHVHLFWHDTDALLVPAIVRHASPTEHGILTGCEFSIAESADHN